MPLNGPTVSWSRGRGGGLGGNYDNFYVLFCVVSNFAASKVVELHLCSKMVTMCPSFRDHILQMVPYLNNYRVYGDFLTCRTSVYYNLWTRVSLSV